MQAIAVIIADGTNKGRLVDPRQRRVPDDRDALLLLAIIQQNSGPLCRELPTPLRTNIEDVPTLQIWYSPNTEATRKGKAAPPDLAVLFDLMWKAKETIFFLAFLPSRAGADSIISAAIDRRRTK